MSQGAKSLEVNFQIYLDDAVYASIGGNYERETNQSKKDICD